FVRLAALRSKGCKSLTCRCGGNVKLTGSASAVRLRAEDLKAKLGTGG
ncbi:hypothetical protein JOC76_006173, partial [Neobacillus cucumis]|nr:hypothetical protein [Neobacillus cucumis]